MQRASGQYDDLTRVPRTGPRQSRGRRSYAARHWCRAAPRCSRGMGTTVRNARIESPIGFPKLLEALFSAGEPRAPAGQFRPEIRSPGTEFLGAETGPTRHCCALMARCPETKRMVSSSARHPLFVARYNPAICSVLYRHLRREIL